MHFDNKTLKLEGKTIVLGVTGGIAAYKACDVVSRLKKQGANVIVIMTKNATEFVSPLTFETMSQNRVITDTFDRNYSYDVQHVSLSKKADLFAVIPATANIIAKINLGLADDMLSTTVMAMTCPVLVCPAMNTNMYNNPSFKANLMGLIQKGYHVMSTASGRLACGDIGEGKLASVDDIEENIIKILVKPKDLTGKTVLITAGATIEEIDGVRFISNYSSGKMGMALAKAAKERGANVILITGKISVPVISGVENISVKSTDDMYNKVIENLDRCDIIIKAAAPADYRPNIKFSSKVKDENLTLNLVKNPDIAKEVGKIKGDKKLIIFCAETDNLIENASKKIVSKNADMIVANDVTMEGAGFNTDTNIATIIIRGENPVSLPIMSKYSLANEILDRAIIL